MTADPGEIEPTPVLTPTMTEMSTVPVTVVTQTVDITSTPLPELPAHHDDSDYDYEESVTDPSKVDEVELEDTCANDTAVVCRNGGICLSTIAGPKCHCPLQGWVDNGMAIKFERLTQRILQFLCLNDFKLMS